MGAVKQLEKCESVFDIADRFERVGFPVLDPRVNEIKDEFTRETIRTSFLALFREAQLLGKALRLLQEEMNEIRFGELPKKADKK